MLCHHSNWLPLPEVVARALQTAAYAHRLQLRKGMDLPYIVHPYSVGMMLHNAGCSDAVVAAGLLHDVPEDTAVNLTTLRSDFGEHIAMIVGFCTEDKGMSWEERKARAIEKFRAAPLEVKLVAAADKLDNLRSIIAEHRRVGEQVWERFNRGREKQAWFYYEVATSLATNIPPEGDGQLFALLCAEVEAFFGEKKWHIATRSSPQRFEKTIK